MEQQQPVKQIPKLIMVQESCAAVQVCLLMITLLKLLAQVW